MTWKQIIPGVYEGIPTKEIDAESDLQVKMSNVPFGTVKTHRLETFQRKARQSWWPKIEQYAEGVYEHPFLTILGAVGTGKTHIAFALSWAWLQGGKSVLYYQVENLLDALRQGYTRWEKGNPDGYNEILQFTQNVGLLVLDDFGAQHETKWAESKLDQIVDYRYEHRKPLIATTNLALTLLPERIADRLTEGTLIQLTGESFRKQKKAKDPKV